MCVIAVCQKRALTDEEVNQMWNANHHGASIAWVKGGQVHYVKGLMHLKDFKAEYAKIKKHLPHVAHFRIASAGAQVPELTHPFIAAPGSPLHLTYSGKNPVLFHNGTYSEYLEVVQTLCAATETKMEGQISDTRVLAMSLYWIPEILTNIKGAGRFVVLGPKEMRLVGSFETVDGIKVSNLFWRRSSGAGVTVQDIRRCYDASLVGTSAWNDYPEYLGKLHREDFEVESGD